MDTAIMRGVGSGRGSSTFQRALSEPSVSRLRAYPEAILASSPPGVRARRGTRRPPREPWPRRWTIPERATAGLSPSAGLVPRNGVTRPGDPLRVPRMAWGTPVRTNLSISGTPRACRQKGRTTVRAGGVNRRPDLNALSPQALRWPGSATPSPVPD